MTNAGLQEGDLVRYDEEVGSDDGSGPPSDGPEGPATGTSRVTAFLPTEVWAHVGAYARAHRTTKTAALRRAISLLWFLHLRPGAQLLCEYPDGRVERLFFLDDAEHQSASPPESTASPPSRRRRRVSASPQR
jgi:hypothetical protein